MLGGPLARAASFTTRIMSRRLSNWSQGSAGLILHWVSVAVMGPNNLTGFPSNWTSPSGRALMFAQPTGRAAAAVSCACLTVASAGMASIVARPFARVATRAAQSSARTVVTLRRSLAESSNSRRALTTSVWLRRWLR